MKQIAIFSSVILAAVWLVWQGFAIEIKPDVVLREPELAHFTRQMPDEHRYEQLRVRLLSQEMPLQGISVSIQTPVLSVVYFPVSAEVQNPSSDEQDGRYTFDRVPRYGAVLVVSGESLYENFVTAIPNDLSANEEFSVIVPLRCRFELEFEQGSSSDATYKVLDLFGRSVPFRRAG